MMKRDHTQLCAILVLLAGLVALPASSASIDLAARSEAEAFFLEYFEHYDAGKVPPRGPSSVRHLGQGGFSFVRDALQNAKYRPIAIRTLGHATTDEDVLRHLYPFLLHDSEDIRAAAVVAIGRRRARAATEKLLPLLHDPDKGVVRLTADALGDCGAVDAVPALVDLYENGNTHDWWGYHIKNEILMSFAQLKAPEALPLCYQQMAHTNMTIMRSAVRAVVASAPDEESRTDAGTRLLAQAERTDTPERLRQLVWGLGRLRHTPAVEYIQLARRRGLIENYIAAEALANIGQPECLPVLMEIYLTLPPLAGMTCLDGEPIGPCLRGLKTITGRDFGDDRKAWREWYGDYLAS